MPQNTVVAQHTAIIARVHMQQIFFVCRVALEQEVVMNNPFYWPEHSNTTALCGLDTVTQYLMIRIIIKKQMETNHIANN